MFSILSAPARGGGCTWIRRVVAISLLVLFCSSVQPTAARADTDIVSCENAQYEFVFAIDSSGSINKGDYCSDLRCWGQMKDFIVRFLAHPRITISPQKSRVSLVRFGTKTNSDYNGVVVDVSLDDTRASDLSSITKIAQTLPYAPGHTPTSAGVDEARNQMTSFSRPNVTKIMVVLTDGFHSAGFDPEESSAVARTEEGINIIAVGIGGYKKEELLNMAGSLDRIIEVSDFSKLESTLDQLLSTICTVVPRNGQWGDWSYEPCTTTCGVATKKAFRYCNNPYPNSYGQPCTGTGVVNVKYNGKDTLMQTQTRDCEVIPCPINCAVSEWGAWSGCQPGCNNQDPLVPGQQTRTRQVTTEPMHGGQICPTLTQTYPCTSLCKVDCELSQWADWVCDAASNCNGINAAANGTKTRTRQVARQPANGGQTCSGPLSETLPCTFTSCTIDCKYSPWADWSTPIPTCPPASQGTLPNLQVDRTRTRTVEKPPGSSANCSAMEGVQNLQQMQTVTVPCNVDCRYSKWTDWSLCSSRCTNTSVPGTMWSSRSIIQQAHNQGTACTQDTHRETKCEDTSECPRDCLVADWSTWTTCTYTCTPGNPTAQGTSMRTRTISHAPMFGGRDCPVTVERQSCTVTSCPVDCVQTEWSSWSICFCGVEVEHNRTRNTVTNATNGGTPCGNIWETEKCAPDSCISAKAETATSTKSNTASIIGAAVGVTAAAGLVGLVAVLWVRHNHMASLATTQSITHDALFSSSASANNPLFASPTTETVNPAYIDSVV
eukprot:comp22742_c0_seq1/m.35458 comp22742_c0_seq1/g.35458  ORF comp22742_c0_seq1/g.35458 comp22742_c0_seq1/m.35458 type:complete len:776 (-) comp22742_c0_seq1:539-2866(-)